MKKLWLLLLAGMFCIGLVACSGEGPEEVELESYSGTDTDTDEAFIVDLSAILVARWDAADTIEAKNLDSSDREWRDAVSVLIDMELDSLSAYRKASFEDTDLHALCISYLDNLEEFKSLTLQSEMSYDEFSFNWTFLSNVRKGLISRFVLEYGLTVDEAHQETLDEFVYASNELVAAGYEEEMLALLESKIPNPVIGVSEQGGTYSCFVWVFGGDLITHFGNYVIDARSAFMYSIPSSLQGSLDVVLIDQGNSVVVAYSSMSSEGVEAGAYGVYFNNRKTSPGAFALHSEEDLFIYFPATRTYLSEQRLDKDDMTIYNEVWDALDSQPNRSEEDIFKELAPNYGMTPDELDQFIWDMMEQIYS